MGDKPKPKQGLLDLEPRKERLVVQCTEAEKRMIERVAKVRHTTLSEAVRQVMYAEAEKLEKGKAA